MSTSVEEAQKSEDKKSELLLDSLEIKGYRCFEHLTIEKLGRVNLIVGKNNVGKTALLEALWIYAKCDNWEKIDSILQTILLSRREITAPDNKAFYGIQSSAFRHLFYNRPKYNNSEDFDNILLIGENTVVSDAYRFYESSKNDKSEASYSISSKKIPWYKRLPFGLQYFSNYGSVRTKKPPHLKQEKSNNFSNEHYIHPEIHTLLIQARGLEEKFLLEKWDEIVWQNREYEIIDALKLLSDDILNFTFTKYPIDSEQHIPVVHIKGMNEKVPLQSFGEGMSRLLGIALALSDCQDGILLVDEIESGLHYSVLPDVWRLIFKTARDLNVQVFATTHSYDCIEAFAQAAIDDEESDGMLIRLARKNEKIKAFTFDEKQLETITKEKIEVR